MTSSRPNPEPLLTAPFLRLWAFSFITFLAAFQLFPVVPFRILELGGSRATAGLFLAVYTWASALSAPLTGALADRIGRRRTLLLSGSAFVIFSFGYGLVTEIRWIFAIAAVHGVFWSALLSASGAMISDEIPVSRRTEGLGYYGMAPTAAMAVAPAVGLTVYSFGWRILTAELVVLSLVIVALAFRVREKAERPVQAPTIGGLGALLNWRVTLTASCIFVIAYGYGGITSYVAILARERDIEPTSLFFTVFALSVLGGRLFLVRYADRAGPVRLLVPSLLAVPPSLLLVSRSHDALSLSLAAVLFGLGIGGAYPALLAWILARTDPARRAATFGSVLLAMDTGIGLGSLSLGRIAATTDLETAFRVAAVVSLLAVPAFFGSRRLLTWRTTPGSSMSPTPPRP